MVEVQLKMASSPGLDQFCLKRADHCQQQSKGEKGKVNS